MHQMLSTLLRRATQTAPAPCYYAPPASAAVQGKSDTRLFGMAHMQDGAPQTMHSQKSSFLLWRNTFANHTRAHSCLFYCARTGLGLSDAERISIRRVIVSLLPPICCPHCRYPGKIPRPSPSLTPRLRPIRVPARIDWHRSMIDRDR
jgi:hypothetical protein